MTLTETRRVFLVAICCLWTLCPAGAAKKRTPIWERAGEAYDAANKLYNLSDYPKAASTFEQFLQKFPSNENVPLAYLQLAHCRQALGDEKGLLEALDTLAKKFPDSYAAGFAWGFKLNHLRGKKEYDAFLDLYEDLTDLFGRAPLGLGDRLDWRRSGDYWYYYNANRLWFYHYRVSGFYLDPAPGMGWVSNLLEVADTPARAQRLLAILEATLKWYGQDLPVDWKYAHVVLLRRAAEAPPEPPQAEKSADGDKAPTTTQAATTQKAPVRAKPRKKPRIVKPGEPERQYQDYLNAWPKGDARAMGFLLYEAGDCQDKEPAKADKIWNDLLERFPKYETLGVRSRSRLTYLADKGRYDDFVRMANWYLRSFPNDDWRDALIQRWIDLASEKAAQGDASQIPVVTKVLDEEEQAYKLNPQRMRRNILTRIDLSLATGDVPAAVKLAEQLVADAYWSAESYDKIGALAKANKDFQPVLDAAQKKHGIPVADSKSPAAAMLENLRGRIADNQLRHMEELGEKLYEEHRNDAYTIEAINVLVDYYFAKVMPKERDKWVDCMVRSYPSHPLTQAVLTKQIDAIHGEQDFKRLAGFVETAMERFPGADRYGNWFEYRIECFSALKDVEGRIRFGRDRLGKRAAMGELDAMGRLGSLEEENRKTWKEKGDYWMPLAKTWSGKPQSVFCLKRAFNMYYLEPCRRWEWGDIAFPEAARASSDLRQQTLDPEIAWKTTFEDINMFGQGNLGADAIRAMAGRLKDATTRPFQIHELLDLPNFGRAVGAAQQAARGKAVFVALKKLCSLKTDDHLLDVMLGAMYQQAGVYPQAVKYYADAGNYYARPIDRWQLHVQMMSCASAAKAAAGYNSLQSKYIARIKTAQDVVPRLLLDSLRYNKKLGAAGIGSAVNYLKALRKRYASSSQRGAAEQELMQK